MKVKRYSTEFKSSIVTLYNEGRSANSLAKEYHLAVQPVMDVTGKPVTRAQFNAMQKEVARLKEENEILKIAAVLLGEHRK